MRASPLVADAKLGGRGRSPRGIALGTAAIAVRAAGLAALAGSVGLSLWFVLIATERPSLLSGTARHAQFASWIVGPLAHLLPSAPADPAHLRGHLLVVLFGLFACWLIAAICAPRLHGAWIAGAVVLAGIVFFLSLPLTLTDLFNYLHYGRMGAVQGLDPYAIVPVRSPHDGWYALTNWHHLLSPYGPLFTLITYPLALLPLHAAYWVWKSIVLLASLSILGLVWSMARDLGRSPQRAVAFVGLNPLVLVYGLGGAHNEPLMMLALVGALALTLRGGGRSDGSPATPAAAGALAVVAAGLKLSTAVLAPLFVLAAPRRRAALAGTIAAAIAVLVVIVAVFSGHLPAIGTQERLVTPLSVPQFFGWLTGQGGLSPLVRSISHVVLAVTVAGAALAVWRRPSLLIAACGTVMLVVILTLGWTMPWYVLWVLPFAALARTQWLAGACVVLTLWLGLGAILQMPSIIHSLGYFPGRTAIGRANHLYTERLLK